MPPIVKGRSSLVHSRTELRYDPATRSRWADEIYQGTDVATRGGFNSSSSGQNQTSANIEDGHGTLIISRPLGSTNDEFVPDRYEITQEFVEKEIWSVPSVVAEAAAYDATISVAEAPTYRKRAEEAAEAFDNGTGIDAGTYPLWRQLVRHLKNGVTGFELEYVVLRRSRRVIHNPSRGFPNPAIDIGDGLRVYSTDQLQLPNNVHFSVPDSAALTPSSADYFWGWRRRPSSSVVEGIFIDQTSEFILSEWSTIPYTQSLTNADW